MADPESFTEMIDALHEDGVRWKSTVSVHTH